MTLTKESFEKIYKDEEDVKTKERMLLVLNVVYQGKISAHVATDLHRNRTWACVWLKRYKKEGLEGLKNKPKTGRPSELSGEAACRIKTTLKESKLGWTTKQVEDLIVKKSGIKYHYTHIYRILRKWGFKQKVPRKVHVNIASKEEKEAFKKKTEQILVDVKQQEQQQESFTVISTYESFFFYDSLVRRVWIDESKRPTVRVTGSHKHSCIFGAISLDGRQIFRPYDRFNSKTFLNFLKKIHAKFPKCYLFIDKASPHYKSKKVRKYFEENKDTLIPVYLPTASPEFMVMEEIWNIAKRDLLVLQYYQSFVDLKIKISKYFRTKRCGLDIEELSVKRCLITYAKW